MNGFSIGRRMSATKIAKTAHLRRRLDRTGHNTFNRRLAHLLRERLNHRVSGLADGDHQDARISLQIIKIFADAQQPALAMHMPRKTPGNRSFLQRVKKNLPRRVAHLAEQRITIGIKHEQIYKDTSRTISSRTQLSIASLSSRKRPSKK